MREPLLTRPFALAFVAHFLHALALHTFLHLPGLLRQYQSDDFTIGLVMGTMSLAAIVARPSIGRTMDVRGRRGILLAGGLLNVVVSLLYLTVQGVGPALFAIRIVHGLAQAMLFSVLFTIAADIVPASRRAEGIGVFGVSGLIPIAVGGLVGDLVLANYPYDVLFVFTACCAALGSLAALSLPDSRPDSGESRPFFAAVTEATLLPIWFMGFCVAVALASYFTFLKTLVIDRGIGSVGLFFSCYIAAAVALRLFLGWVPDRFGLRRTLYPSVLLLAAGLLVLAFADSKGDLMVAGVCCGIGHGYAFPISSALVVNRARPSERGAALAAFTALFDFGLLVGAPLFGFVLTKASYDVMFSMAAGFAIFGIIAYAAWIRNDTPQ